jgi:Zn-dependent protease with chaperone function
MSDIGKILVTFGMVMIVVGGLLLLFGLLFGKVPWLGRLPGDIHIERDNWSVHIPLATSILISIILTLLLSLFSRR